MKMSKQWEPKIGETVYYFQIDINHNVRIRPKEWEGSDADLRWFNVGLIFKSKKEIDAIDELIRPHLDAIKQILKENK